MWRDDLENYDERFSVVLGFGFTGKLKSKGSGQNQSGMLYYLGSRKSSSGVISGCLKSIVNTTLGRTHIQLEYSIFF